ELDENILLEVIENPDAPQDGDPSADPGNGSTASTSTEPETGSSESSPDVSFEESMEVRIGRELDNLEERTEPIGRTSVNVEEADRRYELLYNTPGPAGSLADHLLEQVRVTDIRPELYDVVEQLIFSLDPNGRLVETAEQLAEDMMVAIPLVEKAIEILRALDPPGIAARDLKDCLLIQLDRLPYVRPLTRTLVQNHLDDLALNKLPKIARDTGATIEEVKESREFLRTHVNPHPGAEFIASRNGIVMPDVIVEEIDGKFEVRSLRGDIPDLRISPAYRRMLKEAKEDPKIAEFLKRKIESAKWFIESVHQRQNTIHRIASEIVKRQHGFLRKGTQGLKPMKMQDVADAVSVHISTVSRAVSGKYIQTPQGIMEMKRFFSGGTVTDSGEVMSQQAVKQLLQQIVEAEDKSRPHSDDQLVEILGGKGVHIARRTVTKYRKALGIESSSRRRTY
ncbi:MAG: RNA polymerase factor sigma-54, partial [Planctomycetota bacterium]